MPYTLTIKHLLQGTIPHLQEKLYQDVTTLLINLIRKVLEEEESKESMPKLNSLPRPMMTTVHGYPVNWQNKSSARQVKRERQIHRQSLILVSALQLQASTSKESTQLWAQVSMKSASNSYLPFNSMQRQWNQRRREAAKSLGLWSQWRQVDALMPPKWSDSF